MSADAAPIRAPWTASRRGFLTTCALVVTGLGVGWGRASVAGTRTVDLDALRRADFDGLAGTVATIDAGDGRSVQVRFAGTADLPTGASDPQASFSARFTSTDRERLPQGLHVLEQDDLGRVAIFLVPSPDTSGQAGYEATFNRPNLEGGVL